MLRKTITGMTMGLLTLASLATAGSRPITPTETDILYILPETSIEQELNAPALLLGNGSLWMIDGRSEKLAKLDEGDAVKVTESSRRAILTQKEKRVTLGVMKAGNSDLAEYSLDCLTGFGPTSLYTLINDSIIIPLPTVWQDEEGNYGQTESLVYTWTPRETVQIAKGEEDILFLINASRRQAAPAFSLGEAEKHEVADIDGLAFEMTDGRTWTIFPLFMDFVEGWEAGETFASISGDLDEWFPVEEMSDDDWANLFMSLGDPEWESTENKQMMLALNPTHNGIALLWSDK